MVQITPNSSVSQKTTILSQEHKSEVDFSKIFEKYKNLKIKDNAEAKLTLQIMFKKDFKVFKLNQRIFNDFEKYFTKHIEKKDFLKAIHLYIGSHFETDDKNKKFHSPEITVVTGRGECDEIAFLIERLGRKIGIHGKVIAEIVDPLKNKNLTDGHIEYFHLDEKSKIMTIIDQDNFIQINIGKYDIKDWKELLHLSPSREDIICGKELNPKIAESGEVSELDYVQINPQDCHYYRPTYMNNK